MFVYQRMRTPLAVGGEASVFQVAVGEDLVASGVVVFEFVEGKAREAVHVQIIRGQPGGGARGIVVSILHMWQVDVPVVLSIFGDHR